jgi:hypothetical protein
MVKPNLGKSLVDPNAFLCFRESVNPMSKGWWLLVDDFLASSVLSNQLMWVLSFYPVPV